MDETPAASTRLATIGAWLQLASNVGQIVASVAVVAALIIGFREYRLHFEQDQQERRQAVAELLLKSVDTRKADDALAALHADTRALGRGLLDVSDAEFDAAEGALINYFWAAAACIKAGLCDEKLARGALCHDYVVFRRTQRDRLGVKAARDEADFENWAELDTCLPPELRQPVAAPADDALQPAATEDTR